MGYSKSARHVTAGRAGGEATYQRHGREHYSRISNGRRPRPRFTKKEKPVGSLGPTPFRINQGGIAM